MVCEADYDASVVKELPDLQAKIIQTIDGLAFPTNLLVLNAAVEAARGG